MAEATGFSERTVRRILKEWEEHEEAGISFGTPGKKHNNPHRVTDIDDFDKCAFRRIIHKVYIDEITVPTIGKLKKTLGSNISYTGSSTSLRRIVKRLGFKWKKIRINRSVLIETRRDVCSTRLLSHPTKV